jgi:hypothetical protein
MLDTLQVAVDAAHASGTLPALRTWFEGAIAALRRLWSHLPRAQQFYPAYKAWQMRNHNDQGQRQP